MSDSTGTVARAELIPTLNVSISINDIKVQFNGSPDSVLSSVISFISKQIPAIEIAKKAMLNYSISELIENFSDFVKITPEGPVIVPTSDIKLSDKEAVALYLVATRIGKLLGKTDNDVVSINQIQITTTLNPKSISSRISELVKSGYVSKETEKNGSQAGTYSINTSGIHWLITSISKKKSLRKV
jgi:hypothetical protein